MSANDKSTTNMRDLLFPVMPRWFTSLDWAIRISAAALLAFLAIEARYASSFWTDSMQLPLVSAHLQAFLERDGTTIFPVSLMMAVALVLPSVYVRACAVALVAAFALSGGAQGAFGYTVPQDPYAHLSVVGDPAGTSLSDGAQELWPLEAFEPDADLVAGRRFEHGMDTIIHDATANLKNVIAQDGPKALVMFHEAEAGRIPTIEQVRADYPVMAGGHDVVIEKRPTQAPAEGTAPGKIH
jgi:hypothetical protein